jgi:hypothetical protein
MYLILIANKTNKKKLAANPLTATSSGSSSMWLELRFPVRMVTGSIMLTENIRDYPRNTYETTQFVV